MWSIVVLLRLLSRFQAPSQYGFVRFLLYLKSHVRLISKPALLRAVLCVVPELTFRWDKLEWIDHMSVTRKEEEEEEERKPYIVGI